MSETKTERKAAATEPQTQTQENDKLVSQDVLSDLHSALGPITPTVEDNRGVERIVGPAVDNWQPAQVDPDEDEIKRLAEVEKAVQARREERLGA